MMRSCYIVVLLMMISCVQSVGAAEEVIEFRGVPALKVDTSGSASLLHKIDQDNADEAVVKIVRVGDQYFWRSRGDVLMHKVSAGAFITYIAENGSGYVRVINPSLKPVLCESGKQTLDCKYSYVEHLTLMLSSVTYYGN